MKEDVVPSSTEAKEFGIEYVATAFEVSLTTVDALAPPAVTVNVSGPSVKLSFSRVTDIVARPLALTIAVPLKPPETSAEEMPESV